MYVCMYYVLVLDLRVFMSFGSLIRFQGLALKYILLWPSRFII